jgi:hypothetical protein
MVKTTLGKLAKASRTNPINEITSLWRFFCIPKKDPVKTWAARKAPEVCAELLKDRAEQSNTVLTTKCVATPDGGYVLTDEAREMLEAIDEIEVEIPFDRAQVAELTGLSELDFSVLEDFITE